MNQILNEIDSHGIRIRLDNLEMEYVYGTTTYDLRELPPCLPLRIKEQEVVEALHTYLDAYMADKATIDEPYLGKLRLGQLLRARTHRKKAWFALLDILGEKYDYTDEDLE